METMLRPMSTSELLDRTFFLYRKHFLVFTGIVAMPYLVLLLFQISILRLQSSIHPLLTVLLSLLIVIPSIAAVLISQAASVIAVSDVHLGRPASIGAAYSRIRGSLIELLAVMILMGLGILLGFILCIVPGIILAIVWSLSIPIVLIEIKGPVEAMKRSFALTEGSRSRILIILLLVGVVTYIVTIIIQAPIIYLIGFSGLKNPNSIPAWLNILSRVGSFISSCLVIPISMIATSLVYYDQRVRKEGFDLQLMMSSLKSEQNPPPASTV
jgi:hypothetical protein